MREDDDITFVFFIELFIKLKSKLQPRVPLSCEKQDFFNACIGNF